LAIKPRRFEDLLFAQVSKVKPTPAITRDLFNRTLETHVFGNVILRSEPVAVEERKRATERGWHGTRAARIRFRPMSVSLPQLLEESFQIAWNAWTEQANWATPSQPAVFSATGSNHDPAGAVQPASPRQPRYRRPNSSNDTTLTAIPDMPW
jgi:hypothetical protein